MKLKADIDVINFIFKHGDVAKIAQEEMDEGRKNVFYLVYVRAWKEAEEYHRRLQEKGLSTKQDAINKTLRLP